MVSCLEENQLGKSLETWLKVFAVENQIQLKIISSKRAWRLKRTLGFWLVTPPHPLCYGELIVSCHNYFFALFYFLKKTSTLCNIAADLNKHRPNIIKLTRTFFILLLLLFYHEILLSMQDTQMLDIVHAISLLWPFCGRNWCVKIY